MKIDVIIPTMCKPSLSKVQQHLRKIDLLGLIVTADFSPDLISIERNEKNKDGPAVKHVVIRGHRYFNKSIAINVGFHFTSADFVVVCDADILLDKTFFTKAIMLFEKKRASKLAITPKYVKESADGRLRSAPGICLLHKSLFLEVEGYCNAYKGWGLEDRDFLARLSLVGVEIQKVSWGIHLSHDNEERTKNYHDASLAEMRQKNWELFCSRTGKEVRTGTLIEDISSNEFHELF